MQFFQTVVIGKFPQVELEGKDVRQTPTVKQTDSWSLQLDKCGSTNDVASACEAAPNGPETLLKKKCKRATRWLSAPGWILIHSFIQKHQNLG